MGTLNRIFREELRWLSPQHASLWRNYEIWYNLNDFTAGMLFVVGSALFFWQSTVSVATWLFLIGSILFCVRPGIRLLRDLHLLRLPAPHAGGPALNSEGNHHAT